MSKSPGRKEIEISNWGGGTQTLLFYKNNKHLSNLNKKGIKYLKKNKRNTLSMNTNSNFCLKENKNHIDLI